MKMLKVTKGELNLCLDSMRKWILDAKKNEIYEKKLQLAPKRWW